MQRIVTTSWDDGDLLDLKLADLLAEFGVAGTFYVAPRSPMGRPLAADGLRQLDAGFEIGGHSLTHADLPALDPRELKTEVEAGKRELEDALGHAVTAFSYPFGHYDRRVRRAVADAGFTSARTTRMLRIGWVRDPLVAPTSLRAFPHGRGFWLLHCARTLHPGGLPAVLRLPRGAGWVETGLGLFERMMDRGGVWHLWGHSRDLEQLDLWGDLRRLLKAVSGHAGVHYVPNSEAVLSGSGDQTPRPPSP